MSCYFRQTLNGVSVTIPKYIESSSATYYDIKVVVGKIEWLVERRYRDFAELNQKLIDEMAISKKLLPPKKIVGNKNPTFVEQRREQLEQYLKELLTLFRLKLPKVLAEFLDFNKYDIIYLLQDMAKLFYENGDTLLSSKKEYNLSALEVYAISERLLLPCPQDCIEQTGKYDFSHVLDFCSQLQLLIVTPVRDNSAFGNDYNTVDVPIGRSNIIPNQLNFNLNAFRNLKILKFFGLSTENLIDVTMLKSTLQTICVHNTTTQSINQVLLCDQLHKELEACEAGKVDFTKNASDDYVYKPPEPTATFSFWQQLHELDLTGNLLTHIDASVRTAPQLQKLTLEQNRIRCIKNLADLPHLQHLSLAVNLIADCHDWHLELGNLVSLNLAQNKLRKLSGMRKLLSLINLDLSSNQIEDIDEVDNIACLPLLETLRLTGNPLAGSVDYRARVLAKFHERAAEITLDSERGTQKELDTALVLSALSKSKLRQSNSSGAL